MVHSSSSIALGRPIPAVNKKPAAECEIQTMVQQLLIARPDNHWFWDFSLPHLHSTPPLGGSHWSIAIPFGAEKLEWCGYPMVNENLKILVLTQCMNVTDTHTDRLRIASRGKNYSTEALRMTPQPYLQI